jgi:D-alanyl-D-alanine carboxypeptidase
MAILGQRILKEFPEWSELFKMDSFKVGNRTLRSHNALLRTFEGADGMKTGFICDSGFNVVASATRNDVSVMAVVLGERSSRERTARASELIEHGFNFYGWKEMFSASLDQVAVEKVLDDRPGDMSKLVCRR